MKSFFSPTSSAAPPPPLPDLTGKYCIVTGGNGGIGLATAVELAKLGATVTIASRDSDKTRDALAFVRAQSNNMSATIEYIDLEDLPTIQAFARRYVESKRPLHILVNNAGIMMIPQREETAQGFERQMGTNHLGHYYLTRLLLPTLLANAPARIINLSSRGHELSRLDLDDLQMTKTYSPHIAYGNSKLANIMFAHSLAKKYDAQGIYAFSVHPGMVNSDLPRHYMHTPMRKGIVSILTPIASFLLKSTRQGAKTTLHCALAPLDQLVNGRYYSDSKEATMTMSMAYDPKACQRLWEESATLVGLKP